VVAVSHDIDFAAEQFKELIVLADGQVIARGSAVLRDESILNRAALDAPQLMRLARALGWNESPVDPASFSDVLAKHLQRD
jgi:energy-coupling factor transport system ATP-binding protein